ncbi:hypothetical protein FWH58_03105 [Candidatus Saccharibacteria bacterium]|nr:hypothetical protein [Candidatus Saccharibacteria bacterium]
MSGNFDGGPWGGDKLAGNEYDGTVKKTIPGIGGGVLRITYDPADETEQKPDEQTEQKLEITQSLITLPQLNELWDAGYLTHEQRSQLYDDFQCFLQQGGPNPKIVMSENRIPTVAELNRRGINVLSAADNHSNSRIIFPETIKASEILEYHRNQKAESGEEDEWQVTVISGNIRQGIPHNLVTNDSWRERHIQQYDGFRLPSQAPEFLNMSISLPSISVLIAMLEEMRRNKKISQLISKRQDKNSITLLAKEACEKLDLCLCMYVNVYENLELRTSYRTFDSNLQVLAAGRSQTLKKNI